MFLRRILDSENRMKNSFERATTTENLAESKKKLKAFRSEIYNTIENGQEKKNAFAINREEISSAKYAENLFFLSIP